MEEYLPELCILLYSAAAEKACAFFAYTTISLC